MSYEELKELYDQSQEDEHNIHSTTGAFQLTQSVLGAAAVAIALLAWKKDCLALIKRDLDYHIIILNTPLIRLSNYFLINHL